MLLFFSMLLLCSFFRLTRSSSLILRAGPFIFNLHQYVFYFQFGAQFLVCMYYIQFAGNIFSLHVQFLICMTIFNLQQHF